MDRHVLGSPQNSNLLGKMVTPSNRQNALKLGSQSEQGFVCLLPLEAKVSDVWNGSYVSEKKVAGFLKNLGDFDHCSLSFKRRYNRQSFLFPTSHKT